MTRYLITILLIAITGSLTAQESKRFKKLKYNPDYNMGSVTLLTGEKKGGLIKRVSDIVTKVTFVDSAGTSHTYKAGQIRGFNISGNSYSTGTSKFYKQLRGGKKLSLYVQETDQKLKMESTDSDGTFFESDINTNKTISRYFLNFNLSTEFREINEFRGDINALLDYLPGCPDLIDKLMDTNPDLQNERLLITLVRRYNECVE